MTQSQIKKPTILVVDDLLLNRRIMSCIMRKLGFTVLEANDGLEACDIYDREACDIRAVFLDLNMPQLDGWQTAQRLREMEMGLAAARTRLPVIVCTANDLQAKHGLNATVTSSAISAGADEVMNKPMSMSSVELALDRHLPLWRSLVAC